MECIFDSVEHRTDFERLGGAGCVINSGLAIFRHADCLFRQVARIDELHRIAWFPGSHDFTASVDAHRQIRKTIAPPPRSMPTGQYVKRSVSSRGPTIRPGRTINVFPANHFSASFSDNALSGPKVLYPEVFTCS